MITFHKVNIIHFYNYNKLKTGFEIQQLGTFTIIKILLDSNFYNKYFKLKSKIFNNFLFLFKEGKNLQSF